MIPVLPSAAFRGTSAPSLDGEGAHPVFVGRILWPGAAEPEDMVITLYERSTCGIANEVIGYAVNDSRGVRQPNRAAILLLSAAQLQNLGIQLESYVEPGTDVAVCWATSYEAGAKPFKYARRLSTFNERQLTAFCKSDFCRRLTIVDHVTGNNDRHEANFLFVDDLNYLAIDQGAVGGGLNWPMFGPDPLAVNELLRFVGEHLPAKEPARWRSETILLSEDWQDVWPEAIATARRETARLLDNDALDVITEYMTRRASGNSFAVACGKLL